MTAAAGALRLTIDDAETPAPNLAQAFARYGDALYRWFAVRTGNDANLADELMSQLWLQATRAAPRVPLEELEFWLRAVARNLLNTHWRRQRARPQTVPLADPALARNLAEQLVSADLPDATLDRTEVRSQLLLALTELPAAEQELLIAHYFEERGHAALAAEHGATERAIEGRLYRARASLREILRRLTD